MKSTIKKINLTLMILFILVLIGYQELSAQSAANQSMVAMETNLPAEDTSTEAVMLKWGMNEKAKRTYHTVRLKVDLEVMAQVPDKQGTGTKSKTEKASEICKLRAVTNRQGLTRKVTGHQVLYPLLFNLPDTAVKVGDQWESTLNLFDAFKVSASEFTVDSVYSHNIVKLVDIEEIKGESIAMIEYDIRAFKSMQLDGDPLKIEGFALEASYTGQAAFSLDQGTWISYEGLQKLVVNAHGADLTTTSKIRLLTAN